MAPQSGRADPRLEDTLFEEPYRFDFFQAVRVLERLFPERGPVGRDANPAKEVVRFRSHASLSFPASQIYDLGRPKDAGRPSEMTVAFMGLTGPAGVLPRHYTELILERMRRKDHTLREFLDLFNHRLISLFYRAWEKYRVAIAYERTVSRREGYDPLSACVFDLIGMGTKGLQGRLPVEDATHLFYAGLLAQRPRSASALEGLLAAYFEVPVQTVQFAGQWLPLPEEDRSQVGLRDANCVLGVNAVLGARVWDQQARFALRVGPLTYAQFCDFLPSGTAFKSLVQLTRFFVGQEFDFDVRLVLRAADVRGCRLGETGSDAPRLGWTTWLKTRAFSRDVDDAVLTGGWTRSGAFPG